MTDINTHQLNIAKPASVNSNYVARWSLKVSDVGTNRKLVYAIIKLLVNNIY